MSVLSTDTEGISFWAHFPHLKIIISNEIGNDHAYYSRILGKHYWSLVLQRMHGHVTYHHCETAEHCITLLNTGSFHRQKQPNWPIPSVFFFIFIYIFPLGVQWKTRGLGIPLVTSMKTTLCVKINVLTRPWMKKNTSCSLSTVVMQ